MFTVGKDGIGPAPAPSTTATSHASTPSAGPAPAEPAEHHVPPLGPFDFKAANDAMASPWAWTTIHDTTNLVNSELSGFRSARTLQQAGHLAENASLMGNTAMAERFANIATGPQNALTHMLGGSPLAQPIESFANRVTPGVTSVLENPTMKTVFEGPEALHGFGGLSGAMAGLQLLTAGQELADPKRRTQGALDGVAGALGLASIAQPELAIPAAAAGFIATGNDASRDWGWWGKNSDGENKDSVQWTMDNAASGWNQGRSAMAGTGSRTLTDLGGVIGGGLYGVGSGLFAGAADLGAGLAKTGMDAVGGVVNLAQGVGQFGSEVINDPGAAARDAMNFGSGVVNGGINLANGAINTVGNIIANPGQAAQNAMNTVGNVAQGALNVGSGIVQGAGNLAGGALNVAQQFGSDIAYDAGNVAQGALNVGSGIVQGAGNVASGVAQGAVNLGSGIVQGAGNVLGGIGNAVSSLW